MEPRIKEDLKQAQLKRDEIKVSTLRLLLAEIHNLQIRKGTDLSDDDIGSVLRSEVKKRKEAAHAFSQGGSKERAKKEELELEILESYLPAQLSNEVLTKIVEDAINNIGAKSLSEMGKVMAEVMSKVGGQADGGRVSELVREKLL